MAESLDLEQQRAAALRRISDLEDFRAGSITGTGGRCGNPGCVVIAKAIPVTGRICD